MSEEYWKAQSAGNRRFKSSLPNHVTIRSVSHAGEV